MPPLSARRRAALISGVIFLLIAVLAIHGPSPVAHHALEGRLQRAVDQALVENNLDAWASVDMHGQVATLSGLAPSRQARDDARLVVRRASWVGGLVAGGVTKLVDQTRLADGADRFGLRARLSEGRVSLIGYAPDAASVDRIHGLADQLFSGRVDAQIHIAPGGAPMGWESAVRLLLTELSRLNNGSASIEADTMVLIGQTDNRQSEDAVTNALSATPAGIKALGLINTDPSQAAVIEDNALCLLAMRTAMGLNPIAFEPGLANLAEGSAVALARAGEIGGLCLAEHIQVGVRGDEQGDILALARAEAVIAAMTSETTQAGRFHAEILPAEFERSLQFFIPAPGGEAPIEAEIEDGSVETDEQAQEQDGQE